MAPRTRSLCAAPGVSHARLCQPSLACCTLFRRVMRSPPPDRGGQAGAPRGRAASCDPAPGGAARTAPFRTSAKRLSHRDPKQERISMRPCRLNQHLSRDAATTTV